MTLSDIPRDYNSARRAFETRKRGNDRKPIANNTFIYETEMLTPKSRGQLVNCMALHYHHTTIVTWAEDGCILMGAYHSVSTNDRYTQAGLPSLRAIGSPYLEEMVRWDCFADYPQGVPQGDIWLERTSAYSRYGNRLLGMYAGPGKAEEPVDFITLPVASEVKRFSAAKRLVLQHLRRFEKALKVAGTGHSATFHAGHINPDNVMEVAQYLRYNPEANPLDPEMPTYVQLGTIKAAITTLENTTPKRLMNLGNWAWAQCGYLPYPAEVPEQEAPEPLELFSKHHVWSSRLPAHDRKLTDDELAHALVK